MSDYIIIYKEFGAKGNLTYSIRLYRCSATQVEHAIHQFRMDSQYEYCEIISVIPEG